MAVKEKIIEAYNEGTLVPFALKLILGLVIFLGIFFFLGLLDVALAGAIFFLVTSDSKVLKIIGVVLLVILIFYEVYIGLFNNYGSNLGTIIGTIIGVLLGIFVIIKSRNPGPLSADALLLTYGFFAIIFFMNYLWPIFGGAIISIAPTISRTLSSAGEGSRSTFRALPDFTEYSQQQSAIWDQSSTENKKTPPSAAFQIRNLQSTPSSNLCFSINQQGGTSFLVTGIIENTGETNLENVKTGLKLSTGQMSGVGTFLENSNLYPCEEAIYNKQTGEFLREWLINGEGYLCEQTIDTLYNGQPRTISCTNLYIDRTLDDEDSVTCYIDAFAEAEYHTRALLPVQFIDQEYALINKINYYSPSAITSIGGGKLSIESQNQPILDVEDSNIALTIGISNAGQGTIKDVKGMYLWIPSEFNTCGGSHFTCTDNEDIDCSTWGSESQDCEDMKALNYNLCKVTVSEECKFRGTAFQDEVGDANFCYKQGNSCTMDCDLWEKLNPDHIAVNFCNKLVEAGARDMCYLEGVEQLTRYSCTLEVPYPVTENTFRKTFLFRADAFYDYEFVTSTTAAGEFCG